MKKLNQIKSELRLKLDFSGIKRYNHDLSNSDRDVSSGDHMKSLMIVRDFSPKYYKKNNKRKIKRWNDIAQENSMLRHYTNTELNMQPFFRKSR